MNYHKLLAIAIERQNIDLEVSEIPFNVFLKNTGDVLTLCFLEYESDDCIVVVETNSVGAEELRIIPKFNIEYIAIFYDFEVIEKDSNLEKMFL